MFRLVHFSDIHVTQPPTRGGWSGFVAQPKRWVGALNYALGGRRAHFRGVEARIARLLEAVEAEAPDHALCTGDLTAMAYDAEMASARGLFAAASATAARYTVLPGNHDRYVTEREPRVFERYFVDLADAGRGYPYAKRLAPRVSLVVLDVTRPTGLLDSSGRAGEAQLEQLAALLAAPERADDFVIVALHYALYRADGRRDRAGHGVRDDLALVEVLDRPSSRVDLVLHGHLHRPYQVRTAHRDVSCAGSATDLHVREAGFDVYEIDPAGRRYTRARRVWDGARFVAQPPGL